MKPLLFLFVPALLVAPALAGEPSDLVERFYEDIGLESTLTGRALFTTPAAGIFVMDEKLSNGGEEIGCIDFGLAIDAQDYDDAEIARTLELDETVEGDKATVVASVDIFPGGQAHREIEWTLRRKAGVWKIADVASLSGGWRLSEFDCE